ncbi:hypothetical protein ALO_21012 [Acetonema longum DSM 6540]|uniref:Uncharacterized protein n=1 Tax=Acetonema longum DSM 6540 TaxID=1009370 RepID=F7NQ05_9FIRM|nr:hypothetical protein ALO_21012 [Acetonema longum DSM 6540]
MIMYIQIKLMMQGTRNLLKNTYGLESETVQKGSDARRDEDARESCTFVFVRVR